MTPEEAGQRLLEGVSWVKCPDGCEGGMFYFTPNGGREGATGKVCHGCAGTGLVLPEDYLLACAVLEKAPPTNRPNAVGFTASEDICVGTINVPQGWAMERMQLALSKVVLYPPDPGATHIEEKTVPGTTKGTG